MRTIYLDHASTTPLHPAAAAAMRKDAGGLFADPSRLYAPARRARMALDEARDSIARAVGGRAEEIVFTAGGTESCNLALSGGARSARAAGKPDRVVVSAVEHAAVLEAARALEAHGFTVFEVPVDATGRIDLEALERACAAGAGLVSIQHANGEVGTIQPLAEAARIARQAGAFVHTDACMTVGTIPVDAEALGVDLLSASAHKLYGPKGAGFLWVRRGVRVRPQAVGDDRERHRRAGIQNLHLIRGMAAALAARAEEMEAESKRLWPLSERIRSRVTELLGEVQLHGHPTERLPGLVSFSVLYVEGEALLLMLDAKGFAVHSGSSCASSAQEPSHVLTAMGALTHGSIRVSLGRDTSAEDVEEFLGALAPIVGRLREMAGPARASDGPARASDGPAREEVRR